MKKRQITQSIVLVALALSACGVPADNSQSESDLALTITAQAQLLQALTQTALASTATPAPSATASPSPTPAFTDTPAVVIVTVSANTNCRSGPGAEYEIVGALTIGQQEEVVGKSTSAGYWIINNPNGPGTCWLWGEHATITGDVAFLPEQAVPPTVTPLAALAPWIDNVVVRFDASSGSPIAYIDVYYYDNEGDANLADWQLISASIETSGTIKDNTIAPSLNQRRGSVVTGQWNCGTKVYDVALAVTIRDLAGHSSNSVSVLVSCNSN